MNTHRLAFPARAPASDRAVGLAIVIALHVAAGLGLLALAQPMIRQFLAEPVRIELVSAATREDITPPKPIKPQVQPQRVAPAKRPVATPLLQTEAPALTNTPVMAVAPAPKDAPSAVDASPQTNTTPGPVGPPVIEAVQAPRFDADYLHNPAPSYPRISRELNEEGRVLLRVQVSEEGRALQVLVDTGSGYARLDRAAREAVAQWRFVPAKQGGKALAGWVKVPVIFELNR